MGICRIEGCANPVHIKLYALCNTHYLRIRRYGDPSVVHKTPGNTRHSKYGTPVYNTWSSMKQRCLNPNNQDFKEYGARGITVCDRWLEFKNFYQDMGDKPSPMHSIDRVDNSLGYCPENCRWATPQEQANNRRHRRYAKAPVLEGAY